MEGESKVELVVDRESVVGGGLFWLSLDSGVLFYLPVLLK